MQLLRTIKVIALLALTVVGLPTMAFAHAGHSHPTASQPAALVSDVASAPQGADGATTQAWECKVASARGDARDAAIENHTPINAAGPCVPGTCCCPAQSSSCTCGHCTALAAPGDERSCADDTSRQSLALYTTLWSPAHLIFGLDRPPKG